MWIERENKAITPSEGKRVSGLWTEHINELTGESSYKEHTVSEVASYCKPQDHYFEATAGNSREVVCKKCGFISSYILGLQTLQDGTITDRS